MFPGDALNFLDLDPTGVRTLGRGPDGDVTLQDLSNLAQNGATCTTEVETSSRSYRTPETSGSPSLIEPGESKEMFVHQDKPKSSVLIDDNLYAELFAKLNSNYKVRHMYEWSNI
jgi:hypothetical protein